MKPLIFYAVRNKGSTSVVEMSANAPSASYVERGFRLIEKHHTVGLVSDRQHGEESDSRQPRCRRARIRELSRGQIQSSGTGENLEVLRSQSDSSESGRLSGVGYLAPKYLALLLLFSSQHG